jgi:DNA polymerase
MLTSKEERMQRLIAQMGRCYLCPFAFHRTHVVPHAGSIDAKAELIGEGPGREEDEQGEAFVGPAGREMLQIMGNFNLKKSDFFICNLLKCRPKLPFAAKNNATPGITEVTNCIWYLWEQTKIVQPKLIILTGHTAAKYVLNLKRTTLMGDVVGQKGKLTQFGPYDVKWDCDYMVMYHPAGKLHDPNRRAEVNKSMRDTFYAARQYL